VKRFFELIAFLRTARVVRLQPKDILVVHLAEYMSREEAGRSIERLTTLLREHLGFPVVVVALAHDEDISIVRTEAS